MRYSLQQLDGLIDLLVEVALREITHAQVTNAQALPAPERSRIPPTFSQPPEGEHSESITSK